MTTIIILLVVLEYMLHTCVQAIFTIQYVPYLRSSKVKTISSILQDAWALVIRLGQLSPNQVEQRSSRKKKVKVTKAQGSPCKF